MNRPGFRGGNLSFVAATAALDFWLSRDFVDGVARRSELLSELTANIVARLPEGDAKVKGRGLFLGIEFADSARAERARSAALERGVLVETSGSSSCRR